MAWEGLLYNIVKNIFLQSKLSSRTFLSSNAISSLTFKGRQYLYRRPTPPCLLLFGQFEETNFQVMDQAVLQYHLSLFHKGKFTQLKIELWASRSCIRWKLYLASEFTLRLQNLKNPLMKSPGLS